MRVRRVCNKGTVVRINIVKLLRYHYNKKETKRGKKGECHMDDIKNVVRIEKTRVIKDYSVGIYAYTSCVSTPDMVCGGYLY